MYESCLSNELQKVEKSNFVFHISVHTSKRRNDDFLGSNDMEIGSPPSRGKGMIYGLMHKSAAGYLSLTMKFKLWVYHAET